MTTNRMKIFFTFTVIQCKFQHIDKLLIMRFNYQQLEALKKSSFTTVFTKQNKKIYGELKSIAKNYLEPQHPNPVNNPTFPQHYPSQF